MVLLYVSLCLSYCLVQRKIPRSTAGYWVRTTNILYSSLGYFRTTVTTAQSFSDAGARLELSARKSEHITPLLRELHWLQVPDRTQFRLCVLAYRCLIGTAASYLAEILLLIAY